MLFDIMAPFYDKFVHRMGTDFKEQLAQWLDPKPGEQLLDLGGGTGLNVSPLVQRGALVTLLDASQAMLNQAKDKMIPAVLTLGDARRMPFPDNSFDGALCSDAWHHMEDQELVAGELVRVMKPNGRLVILEFDPRLWQVKILRGIEVVLGESGTFVTPEDLANQFKKAGIVGEVTPVGRWQYVFIGVNRKS